MSILRAALVIGGVLAVKAAMASAARSRHRPTPQPDGPDEPDTPDTPDTPDEPIVQPHPPPPKLGLLDWTPPPKSMVPQMFAQAHLVGRALENVVGKPCLEWEVYRTHTPFMIDGRQHDTVLMYRSCFDSDWMPFVIAKGKAEEQIRDLEVKAALNDIRAETLSAYTKAAFG